jgi:eukaryotic-like serine/threonine-protein kinase
MEHVSGQTLSELITQNRLELHQALRYGVQIADALAKAHSAGIVHRDVKPSNIIVTPDGLVKVLDFGLAKLVQPRANREDDTTCALEPRTAAGKVIGTVGYMSPEQIEGKQVDQRSDIFSFGALLYEMVTGRRTFQSDSNISTLAAVLHTEAPPLGPECPYELAQIIARCLRKDPERRWQSMADLKVALVEVSEQWESGSGMPPRMRRHGRLWPAMISAAGIIVSVGTILFGVLWHRSQPPALEVVPFSTYPGVQSDPVFSPDGNQVAFAWDGGTDEDTDIYVKQIGEETPLRLTSDPAPDLSPAWSPDGRFIAFVRELASGAKYFVVPAIGGPEHELAETHDPASIIRYLTRPLEAWSPDGKWLALSLKPTAAEPFSLTLLNVETGETRRLTRPPEQSFGDAGPAFSPKADALVFGRTSTYGISDLHLLSLEHGLMVDGVRGNSRLIICGLQPRRGFQTGTQYCSRPDQQIGRAVSVRFGVLTRGTQAEHRGCLSRRGKV